MPRLERRAFGKRCVRFCCPSLLPFVPLVSLGCERSGLIKGTAKSAKEFTLLCLFVGLVMVVLLNQFTLFWKRISLLSSCVLLHINEA